MEECYAHCWQWKPWRKHILGSPCCFSWFCCARWSNSLSFLKKGKLHWWLSVKSLSCICEMLFHKMYFSSLFSAFILEMAYLLYGMLSSILIWFNLIAFLKHIWKFPIFSFFSSSCSEKWIVGITFESIPQVSFGHSGHMQTASIFFYSEITEVKSQLSHFSFLWKDGMFRF